MEQKIKLLKAVEETLGKVTVCGAENMDRLLGCIYSIRGVWRDLEKLEKEADANASEHENQ